ncbi:NADH dehydrogenase [ubiquinone] 1 beta subcomplex subunit 8, mitochondrial [Lepeophtheirus salmonis]|uniref:NADH dehydrogenase 1 beta subcomplex subunit 8, mitochondrial n=1 Tax=Lepeophtheirus salmonis TaxID=72036 RepID=C1BRV9_LEPSM|nr:NADH dehydrogenase [ubiquinone] 1 beta subcomplex subunit 8, mitochondrial-like [Lepeophtheirus salmonis]ACO11762.1 NADH dehydrogenase 1 beta subcomplex subunit 8, mitochondrial precursor [Lepeophtheirus salmonis]
MAISNFVLRQTGRALTNQGSKRCLTSTQIMRGLDDEPEGKGPWNYIWKPSPYPKTEEERIKAAYKYGMIPDDYVPIKDDGDGIGDYPDLGNSSMDSRSGYVAWDFPNLKRNYGEPIHIDFLHTMDFWGLDDTTPAQSSMIYKMSCFLAYMMVCTFLMTAFPEYQVCIPMAEQQLVTSKETHYTFEPLD